MSQEQALYLVLGGEVTGLDETIFRDPSAIDVAGIFASRAEAERAWKQKAQASVDNAHMRYFLVDLTKALRASGDGS